VNFTQDQYTFTEGQNGSICVKGIGRWDQLFSVDIQVVNDTAIGMDRIKQHNMHVQYYYTNTSYATFVLCYFVWYVTCSQLFPLTLLV